MRVARRLTITIEDDLENAIEEAAELLELDVRNFKSRLHRGRMELRRRLEELSRD